MTDDEDSPSVVNVTELQDTGHDDFNPDDPDTYVFESDFESTYKTYARGMYDSPREAIRELFSNATTAIERAIEEADLDPADGVIEIILDRDRRILTIRDNGIGITRDDIERIMTKLSKSTSFLNPKRAGQFGVGFISSFMLVDLEGVFMMYSRPRLGDDGQIKGTWHGGRGFKERPNLSGEMDDDAYGTRFEFPLASTIDLDQIYGWVESVCSRSKVPVYYKEIAGGEVEDDEFGGYDPTEKYSDYVPVLSYETEYFEAYNSPHADWETTLIHAPIELNHPTFKFDLPFRHLDLRLKYESGVVVDGPNEGCIPVDFEYSAIPEEFQKDFIPRSDLQEDDVVMPGPTQDRSRLRKNEAFREWLEDELWGEYMQQLGTIFSGIESVDDLFALPRDDYLLACSTLSTLDSATLTADDVEASLDVSLDVSVTIPRDVKRVMDGLQDSVSVVERQSDVDERANYTPYPAYVFAYRARQTSGEVYMGASMNQDKAEVIWEDDAENMVVEVESADAYEHFEALGWRKLKVVSADTIDQFDVSDETAEQWTATSRTRRSVGERDILIHFGSPRHRKHEWRTEELYDALATYEETGDREAGLESLQTLVLFPSDTDENISDWYSLARRDIGIATCVKETYTYLSQFPCVQHIDDYIQQAADYTLLTTAGERQVGGLDPSNVMFHLFSPSVVEDVRQSEETLTWAREGVSKVEARIARRRGGLPPVYAAITMEEFRTIRPVIPNATVVSSQRRFSDSFTDVLSINNNTGAYAYALLPDYHESDALQAIVATDADLVPYGKALVQSLRE